MDIPVLQAYHDGDHADIRAQVKEILTRPEFAKVDEIDRDAYRELVLQWAKALAAAGGTSLGFPAQYGGGEDIGGSIVGLETVAHHDLSLMVKCGVQFGLWGGAVLHLGSKRHHDAYLEKTRTLELAGCFAMTESGHGSNVQGLRTTATYDPETREFVINTPDDHARKDYIGNAACHATHAAVFAQLVVGGESKGVHCFVVEIRDDEGHPMPGVRIADCGHKMGLNGVDNGRLWFDQVRIPREQMLDRYAQVSEDGVYSSEIENPDRRFFTMLGTLVQGRVCISGASLSAAKNAITIAIRHAERRRQFGPAGAEEVPLMSYRSHQLRLLPRLAATWALHVAQQQLVSDCHDSLTHGSQDRRRLESDAAGLKALSSWHARDTIQTARECTGGFGYMAENQLGALKADSDIFTTFEGDNTVLLQLVGKGLLTAFKQDFGQMNPLGTMQFVASQVFEEVVEKSAVGELLGRLADDLLPGRDERGGLLDREVQNALLEWRAEHVLSTLVRRLKRGVDAGRDPFEVFLECQDHVVYAGRTHTEFLVQKTFSDHVARHAPKEIKPQLELLADLHALWLIHNDRGWFQEHGRLSSTRSKAIGRAIAKLCDELRPHAVDLVAGFGIPDEFIVAPIGVEDPAGPIRAGAVQAAV